MARKARKPVRVNQRLTDILLREMEAWGLLHYIPEGIKLYVTDTTYGRYSDTGMNITVPTWAATESHTAAGHEGWKVHDPEYQIYYACHEIAHAYTDVVDKEKRQRGVMHSPLFYERFKMICPAHLHHHEIGYKPSLAAAAGITRKNK